MVIGMLGLGAMGLPIAENLVKQNMTVYGYDVSVEQVKRFTECGGIGCASVAEAVSDADVILASLPNPEIVEHVMLASDGALDNCRPGACIVDLSSVGPFTSEKIYAAAAAKNIGYADAPVSGGVRGARAGKLTIMFGGDEETYASVHPVLEMIGKKILYVGGIGSGDAIKLVNNLMLGCNMAAVAEALMFGKKLGLSLETIMEVVSNSSGNSYAFSAKLGQFIIADEYDGGFATELQLKDLNLALETAKQVQSPMPMTAVAAQLFGCSKNMGNARKDISSLVQLWERLTNTNLTDQHKETAD